MNDFEDTELDDFLGNEDNINTGETSFGFDEDMLIDDSVPCVSDENDFDFFTMGNDVTENECVQDYYTVGEFAQKVGVTKEQLKSWDKQGKYEPEMRGSNGTRLYSQRQVDTFWNPDEVYNNSVSGFSEGDIFSSSSTFEPENFKSELDELKAENKKLYMYIGSILHCMNTADRYKYDEMVELGKKMGVYPE
jgi:hypothetical protein